MASPCVQAIRGESAALALGTVWPRQGRAGLLEQADDDTLLLDEITDNDRDTLRLLLAALDSRGHQRLGEA
jgi:transcriptional regulator with AAA-type ATPase domain